MTKATIAHVLRAAGPRSIRPTTTHRGRHRLENSLHHVKKKFSRVSVFNPAHLSGNTQDANYVSLRTFKHELFRINWLRRILRRILPQRNRQVFTHLISVNVCLLESVITITTV